MSKTIAEKTTKGKENHNSAEIVVFRTEKEGKWKKNDEKQLQQSTNGKQIKLQQKSCGRAHSLGIGMSAGKQIDMQTVGKTNKELDS